MHHYLPYGYKYMCIQKCVYRIMKSDNHGSERILDLVYNFKFKHIHQILKLWVVYVSH